MKQITREWLTLAHKDLVSCEKILGDSFLTSIVSFHAQQAVEKSFKAVIDEFEIGFIKTHNLLNLYDRVKGDLGFALDLEVLNTLSELYISTRYPGALGLLPDGDPGLEDARLFYEFAQDTFEKIKGRLEQTADVSPGD